MGSEGERLAATPAEPPPGYLTVARRQVLAVVCCRVQVRVHNRGVQSGNRLDGCLLRGKLARTSAAWPKTGQQVRCNHNETLCSQFIGHLLGPVAETEDLMDQHHNRRFVFHLWIHHKSLHRAVAVLERNVFMMAWRSFKPGFGPVLSLQGNCGR